MGCASWSLRRLLSRGLSKDMCHEPPTISKAKISSLKTSWSLLPHLKPGQRPKPQRTISQIEATHINRTPALNLDRNPCSIQIIRSPGHQSPVANFSEDHLLNHRPPEQEEQREKTKEQNVHSTKTNPEISPYTYNHSKSTCLDWSSVRTHLA